MESFNWRGMNHRDLSLFCYCILMLALNISAINCPTGYTQRGSSSCYKFYTQSNIIGGEGKTWVDAQRKCEDDSANLLSLSSDTDGRFYRDLMSDNSISEAWIGAYLPTYGEWQYISDESYGSYQGCYSYDSGNTDFSGDITSTSFPASSVTRTTCANQCRNDGRKYAAVFNGNRCMCADQVTRGTQYVGTSQPCTKECADNSSESCGSQDYNNYVDILNVDGEWMVPTGSGQPNNFNDRQSCYVIDQYLRNKLNDHNCDASAYYICRNNNGFSVSTNRKSWFEARMACLNSNGDLAKINTAAEWGSLIGQLQTDQLYYIGLTNRIWRWKGQEGSSITYSKWASGKPGDKDNLCAYLDSEYKWQDAPCNSANSKKYFFCEIIDPPTTTTSTTTTTTTTTPTTTTTTTPTTTTTTAASTTTTTSTSTSTTSTAATTTSTAALTASTTTTTSGTTTTGTTASTTTAATTATTAATTATTAANTTTAGTNGGGNTGAATGGSSSLSTVEIILIVVCCIFLILIIILIIVLCYYKKRNNRRNKISGYQDTRNEAHIPYSGSIGDEVYLPASENGSNSSRSNLIHGGVPPRKPKGYEPSPRPSSITNDERY